MLEKGSALAVIPKARAMFSRRLTKSEYAELERRRTVPELALFLKNHPYFKDSLKAMPTQNLHRAQLENLLTQDMLIKYQSLLHYDYVKTSFARFFAMEVETQQIITALRFLAMGHDDEFIAEMPMFLQPYIEVNLMNLARASSFKELLRALTGTPYYKVLEPIFKSDPKLENLQLMECAMLTHYYSSVLELADKNFKGSELRDVKELFLEEAELYNINMLFRIKTFFPDAYDHEQLKAMLLPIYYKVSHKKMEMLTGARNTEEITAMLIQMKRNKIHEVQERGNVSHQEDAPLYSRAITLLHFTSSPAAALAAFMCFAKLERSNIINCLEGVRYGLAPEEIEKLILY